MGSLVPSATQQRSQVSDEGARRARVIVKCIPRPFGKDPSSRQARKGLSLCGVELAAQHCPAKRRRSEMGPRATKAQKKGTITASHRRLAIARATRAFFHFFNPFFPLFSEHAFYSRRRSPLLRAIVACIGLERMAAIDATPLHSAILDQMTHAILQDRRAPLDLDTLQCRLLVTVGLKSPKAVPLKRKWGYSLPALLTLLGLHRDVDGPLRLERRLALQAACCVGQFKGAAHMLRSPAAWLSPTTLAKPHPDTHISDQFHLVTSSVLFRMQRATAAFLKADAPPPDVLVRARLLSSLRWGWSLLRPPAKRIAPHIEVLLVQCRLFLAICFHYSTLAVCQDPRAISRHGISSATSLARLTSLLNVAPFEIEYTQLLTTAASFVASHAKPSEEAPGSS